MNHSDPHSHSHSHPHPRHPHPPYHLQHHTHLETFFVSPTLRLRLDYDDCSRAAFEPANTLGRIAYLQHSRYVLGDQALSRSEMDQVARRLRRGELLGWPVWAYVHSGVVLHAGPSNPFADPVWDSAQSGFVYCTPRQAATAAGQRNCTQRVRAGALQALQDQVLHYSRWLQGECYCWVLERYTQHANGTLLIELQDSCGGYDDLDFCRQQALQAAQDWAAVSTVF